MRQSASPRPRALPVTRATFPDSSWGMEAPDRVRPPASGPCTPQAQARPADRVEEEAIAALEGGQLGRRDFAQSAQRLRVHADEVEGYFAPRLLEHVHA